MLVGTLDTKGDEYAYLRDRLHLHGVNALLVDVGTLDPDQIHTPGIFVNRIIHGAPYQKLIEKRTVRKHTEDSRAVVA